MKAKDLREGDELIMSYDTFKIVGVSKKSWGKIQFAVEHKQILSPVDPRCPGKHNIRTYGTNGGCGISMEANEAIDPHYGYQIHFVYRNGKQIYPEVKE